MTDDYLDDVIMPFGKYAGEYICDLPINYLEFLRDKTLIRGELLKSVEKAIDDHYDNPILDR